MLPRSSIKGMKYPFLLLLILHNCVLSDGQRAACNGQTLDVQATPAAGSIYSPNYPFRYPGRSYCTWHITTTSENSFIEVSINDFIIEGHRRCRFDQLMIYKGSDANSPLLARLCGRNSYRLKDVSVNELFVVFSSDRRVQFKGFSMSYQSITMNLEAQTCQSEPLVLEAESSPNMIESPGYPIQYSNNALCSWTIVPPDNSDVFVTITDIVTERTYDHITITGESVGSIELSGTRSNLPGDGTFLITGTAAVTFTSDESQVFKGFQLTYQAIARPVPQDDPCAEGGLLTLTATFAPQTFESPLYPADYPNDANCNWRISSPGDYVLITVNFLQLQHHTSCELDALLIYDGGSQSSRRLARLCGGISSYQYSSRYWSTSDAMFINFQSDRSESDNGFVLTYQRSRNTYQECQGPPLDVKATLVSQNIDSPNYPDDYFNNALCGWLITSSSGFVFLQVEVLKLQNTSNCASDVLEIFDGMNQHAEILARLCGQDVIGPSSFRSSTNQVFVRFRSDESMTDEGFRLNYESEASSDLACQSQIRHVLSTPSSQMIQSPNYPGSAPPNSICHWLIKSSSDFVMFEIEDITAFGGSDCDTAGLEIFNGSDSSAPLFINICGENAAVTEFTIPFNEVYVRYRTTGVLANNGFNLNHHSRHSSYEACYSGPQNLQASYLQANIKSPDYPRMYPSNSSCEWKVNALEGVVFINVLYLSIPSSPMCAEAALEIYDGPSDEATVIRRYCGRDSFLSERLLSSSSTIFIHFHSTSTGNGGGFLLTYSGINETHAACQGIPLNVIASPDPQTIYSPSSPQNYPNNANCRWSISSPTSKLRIAMEYFAIEDHSDCMYDKLEIFEGSDSDSPHIAKLCGEYDNKLMYTSSSDMTLLHFQSDWSETAMGFQITFYSVTDTHPACMGGPLEVQANSDFQQLEFPDPYSSKMLCSWVIESSLDFVYIDVERVDIENTDGCTSDGLEIFDGDSQYTTLLTKLCGSSSSGNMIYRSSSKKLYIRFYSDMTEEGQGFRLVYRSEAELNPACNGSIEFEARHFPQIIDSPRFPMVYPSDLICEWKIMSPNGFIRIYILELWLPDSTNCTSVALEIFDGEDDGSPHLVKLCGKGIVNMVGYKSTSSEILIRFHSDDTSADRGFRLSYSREDDSQDACLEDPLTLQATPENKTIQSHGFPSAYQNNENCGWIIESPTKFLRLSIEYLWLEYHSRCDYDVLEIYQGASMSSPLVTRLCGNLSSTLSDYWISSNVTYIWHHTDNSVTYPGFRLTFQSVAEDYGCQAGPFDVQASMYPQSIESPGYPQAYPVNVMCIWRIKSSLAFIHINLEDLHIVESPECSNDALEIFDGSSHYSPNITRLCSQDSSENQMFISSSDVVTIHFLSDATLTGRGFRLTYMSVDGAYEACNDGPLHLQANLDMLYMESPGFPNAYPSNSDCSWRITSPTGNVVFSFTEFRLYNHSSCMNDAVVIFDGPDETSPKIGEFCGQNPPTREYTSSSNGLYVQFHSDHSFTSAGFHMAYRAPACPEDEILLHASEIPQVLESNEFPRVYYNNTYCSWLIESPNNFMLIEILDLEFTDNFDCDHNSLQIIDGYELDGVITKDLCGAEDFNSRIILTPSNVSVIHFRSDGSSDNRGFRLTYQAVDEPNIVCSRPLEVQATDQVHFIESPGYPDRHPSICEWVIRSSESNVRLFARRFRLPPGYDCINDSLEIFDGPNATAPRIANVCAENSDDWVYTSGNVAFVLFQSMGNQSIFELAYQSVDEQFEACRGNTVELNATSSPQTLMSPHYPMNYPTRSICRWQIQSSGSYLLLQIEDIEIEDTYACVEDVLRIYDGGNDDALSLAQFCGFRRPFVSTFWTSSNLAFLLFSTSWINEYRGFRLTYQSTEENAAACRGEGIRVPASNVSKTLTSPGYPDFYANFTDCSWVIESSSDIVHIVIEDLRIQPHFRDECYQDVLEIYDGEYVTAPLIDTLCGTKSNLSYWSGHNVMLIVFRTDRTISGHGFNITYNAEDRTHQACIGDLLDLRAVHTPEDIYSPGYPISYPSNADCAWHIGTSSGIVHLHIESLNIVSSENCASDGLEIFDGHDENSPILVRLCGEYQNYSRELNSSTNEVFVRFYSDGSGSSTGFLMHYYSQAVEDECTDTPVLLQASSVELTFTTPGYDDDGYEHNLECSWLFWAPGAFLHLNIKEFHLEYDTSCGTDTFEIFDGRDRSAKRLAILCADLQEHLGFYWSTSSYMFVHFQSNSHIAGRGVRLTYQRVDKPEACPTLPVLLTADKSLFNYPDIVESSFFPTPLPSGSQCEWHITSLFDYVFINVTDVLIAENLDCEMNTLEIFDAANGTEVPLAKFCGGETFPALMISKTNFVILRFKTGGSQDNLGFRMEYFAGREEETACFGIDEVLYAHQDPQILTSPFYPENYDNISRCNWVIKAPGAFLRISINVVDLQYVDDPYNNITECIFESLTVYDGPSAHSPVMGIHCFPLDKPIVYWSSSDTIRIYFYSDTIIVFSGFSLTYQSVDDSHQACQIKPFEVVAPDFYQTIFPPRYPDGYPSDCSWKLISSIDFIALHADVRIPETPSCETNFLEIFDGSGPSSQSVAKLCGEFSTEEIVGNYKEIFLHFVSEGPLSENDFNLTYKSVEKAYHACMTGPLELVAPDNYVSESLILAPTYKGAYPADCSWIISSTEVYIRFRAGGVRVYGNSDCIDDNLFVYDGSDENAPLLVNLCGEDMTEWYYSLSSDTIYVHFETDGPSNRSEFQLIFESIDDSYEACRGPAIELTATSSPQFITSPRYPTNYPIDLNCRWHITAPPGQYVEISFTDVNIQPTEFQVCTTDELILYDGPNDSSSVIDEICVIDDLRINHYWTSSNEAFLYFYSDVIFTYRGFNLTYISTVQNYPECRGSTPQLQATSSPQVIMSPRYPEVYPNKTRCSWQIETTSGIIYLDVQDFELQFHPLEVCDDDALEIYDGPDENARRLANLCGNKESLSYWSTSNSMFIHFRTDPMFAYRGFMLTFQSVQEVHRACNDRYVDVQASFDWKTIESPDYPSSYPNDSHCAWRVHASSGILLFLIEDLHINDNQNCESDALVIYDGLNENATQLAKLCGQDSTNTTSFLTSSSTAYIQFYTDMSDTDSGFKISYRQMGNDYQPCQGKPTELQATSTVQTINWLGLPLPQNGDTGCTWNITTTAGFVRIIVQHVSMNSDTNCPSDYLEIYDGDTTNTLLGKVCDTSMGGFQYQSSGNMALLQMNLANSETFKNIQVSYFAAQNYQVCQEGTVTVQSQTFVQVIESPGYPTAYPGNSICQWRIESVTGSIYLNLTDLMIAESNNCVDDALEIYDGINETANRLAQVCGEEGIEVREYTSTTNLFFIRFQSDAQVSSRGFLIYHQTEPGNSQDCPSYPFVLKADYSPRLLLSPGYPQYADDMVCEWRIWTPNDHVHISFNYFSLEPDEFCSLDWVEIFDGPDSESQSLARLCYPDVREPYAYTSSSSVLFLHFESDFFLYFTGFNLTYEARVCPHNPVVLSSSIEPTVLQSPGIPRFYPSNTNCTWQIESEEDYILINVQTLSNTLDCVENGIEIFDGNSIHGTNKKRPCGENPQSYSFLSSSDSVLIHFRSNGSSDNDGFILQYQSLSACAGGHQVLFALETSQTITSPGYPNAYPLAINCEWVIESPAPMLLTLGGYKIESHPICAHDALEIYEGDDQFGMQRARLCGESDEQFTISTTSNLTYIRFYANEQVSDEGFTLDFRIL